MSKLLSTKSAKSVKVQNNKIITSSIVYRGSPNDCQVILAFTADFGKNTTSRYCFPDLHDFNLRNNYKHSFKKHFLVTTFIPICKNIDSPRCTWCPRHLDYSRDLYFCRLQNSIITCEGDLSLQNYNLPFTWMVELGYQCRHDKPQCPEDVQSQVKIEVELTNQSNCEPVSDVTAFNECRPYIGNRTVLTPYSIFNLPFPVDNVYGTHNEMYTIQLELEIFNCYQHAQEYFCRLILLECDPYGQVFPVCQYVCESFLLGCQEHFSDFSLSDDFGHFCELLPTANCINLTVDCGKPDAPKYGNVYFNGTGNIHYTCITT